MADSPFVDFPAGSTMLREGEAASALFIIEAGKAAIERSGTTLAELGPGDVFGEAALLQEQGHAANVVARTAVRALKLDTATLPAVMRENVDVAMLLMRRLAQRLRVADERGAVITASRPSTPASAPVPAVASPASRSEPVPAAAAVAPTPLPAAAAAKEPASAPPVAAAVDIRARSPQVSPAPVGLSAQSLPSGPVVVQYALRHTQGAITIPSDKDECLVGRLDPATGAIPEINLGPLDLARSLSRRHARLLVTGNSVSLREEPGVSNGTWVNGERLTAGQTVALEPGDKLRFGAIELEFGTA